MTGTAGGRKVVCVGRNKTATTSLESALRSLGPGLGLQARGQTIPADWARRDFARVVALCRTADAFQDVPSSYPETCRAVDAAFPGSKFILTVRDRAQQWFDPLVRFHTRIVGKGRLPTADDLRAFDDRYPGCLWEGFVRQDGDDERRLYHRDLHIFHDLEHHRSVTEQFHDRPDDLLVLNVAHPDAMQRLCDFIGAPYAGQAMPHLNRSA